MGCTARYHTRRKRRRENLTRAERARINAAQTNRHNVPDAANQVSQSDSDSDHAMDPINAQDVVDNRFQSSDDEIPLSILRVGSISAPNVVIPPSPEASAYEYDSGDDVPLDRFMSQPFNLSDDEGDPSQQVSDA